MQELMQSVLNGILLGGLYAIIGLGMSMIFGIMGLTNLAHGDLMIFSTFITILIMSLFSGNLLIGFIITIIVMIVIGYVSQTFLINKVLDKGSEPPLLVTFGLSIILQNVLLLIFGADARNIQSTLSSKNIVTTKLFSVSAIYFIDFVVALIIILGLHYIMQKTYLGRSIRAVSDDVTAAELMGVNSKRIYSYTMCIAMIIATVAGILVGLTFISYPSSGTPYLIIAFGVVVIGGMGSLVGTLLGGVVLGVSQLLGSHFFGSGYQLLAGYIVLIIILTIKPEGLLAKVARK